MNLNWLLMACLVGPQGRSRLGPPANLFAAATHLRRRVFFRWPHPASERHRPTAAPPSTCSPAASSVQAGPSPSPPSWSSGGARQLRFFCSLARYFFFFSRKARHRSNFQGFLYGCVSSRVSHYYYCFPLIIVPCSSAAVEMDKW